MKNYLQVNYDGSIFQYSKDPKDGFVEHKNSKGNVSYRKYFNKGVDGELVDIFKRNNQYKNGAEELSLVLKDGEDENVLVFNVLNQDGSSIDEFTEPLLTLLPKMNKGSRYNVNNWFMKKGDTVNGEEVKYNRKGVTVKLDGNKIQSDITFEYTKKDGTHVAGDVPQLVWKEVAGKNRPTAASKEARLIYLYELMDREIVRISGGTTTEQPQQQATNTAPVETDDLPF